MFKRLKAKFLGGIIMQIIEAILTEDNYNEIMDSFLDWLERLAERTDNDLDDRIVARLRTMLGVPDGDD